MYCAQALQAQTRLEPEREWYCSLLALQHNSFAFLALDRPKGSLSVTSWPNIHISQYSVTLPCFLTSRFLPAQLPPTVSKLFTEGGESKVCLVWFYLLIIKKIK